MKRGYDVIHVHNMPDFLVFAAVFPRLVGAKVILDVQDASPELMAAKTRERQRAVVTRLAIWQEHISTIFAQHVITVGWPFEELLLQRGAPRGKMSILLNSADPKMFPRFAPSAAAFGICTSGPTADFDVPWDAGASHRAGCGDSCLCPGAS